MYAWVGTNKWMLWLRHWFQQSTTANHIRLNLPSTTISQLAIDIFVFCFQTIYWYFNMTVCNIFSCKVSILWTRGIYKLDLWYLANMLTGIGQVSQSSCSTGRWKCFGLVICTYFQSKVSTVSSLEWIIKWFVLLSYLRFRTNWK